MSGNTYKESQDLSVRNTVSSAISNPIAADSSILSYYTDANRYNEVEIFDRSYDMALKLSCGDRLLKPASTINSVIIRKTTSSGLYKLIFNDPDKGTKIKYLDEGELLNNRACCSGTISKNNIDQYELTYFDDKEIVIEYYSKEEVIDFMNKNKLIFQN